MIAAATSLGDARGAILMPEELVLELQDALESFVGDDSLKEIFWSILSYDRQRASLSLDTLRHDVADAIAAVELFATHDNIGVVRAEAARDLSRDQIESLCRCLESQFASLILVLHVVDSDEWSVVYPDTSCKHHLRFLALPGAQADLLTTSKALAALTAVDWETEEDLQRLEIADRLDAFFPGDMPKQRWEFDPLLETQYDNSHMRKKAAPLAELYEDIARYPLLTERQERGEDLDRNGNEQELEQYRWRLVLHNIRLVIHVAMKFPSSVLDIEDLVQEGILGLITAARKFDPARGNRFSTYAWYWIRQGMFRAMANNQNAIRWPVHRLDDLVPANANGETADLTPGERRVKYFDDGEPAEDDQVEFPEDDRLERLERIAAVLDTMGLSLNDRQKRIIEMRFGFGGHSEHTLEEVGQVEGVTRERIRQIQQRAMQKIECSVPPWLRRELESPEEATADQGD